MKVNNLTPTKGVMPVKKTLTCTIAALALLAMSVAPTYACDSEKKASATTASAVNSSACASKTEASMASEKAGCAGMAKQANAKMAGASGCTPEQMAACIAKGCTVAACDSDVAANIAKDMKYDGKLAVVNMSVKGMTCGGCAGSVTSMLAKQEGVIKVLGVDHKAGFAKVVVDPAKVKSETIAQLVTAKGYQSEIIPAVATTTTGTAGKACTIEDKAACAAKSKTEASNASVKSPQ